MRLSPIPPRQPSIKKKTVSWSDSQQRAIVDLITEASALIDVFDQVSLLLGPHIKLRAPTKIENTVIGPSKWGPILERQCQELEEELNNFKVHEFRRDFNYNFEE